MEHLQKGIPVLASLDIDKTLAFYQEKLGFDKIGYKDQNYAVIARDQVVLHFWKCDDPFLPQNTSCYIDVVEIDRLYEELEPKGIVHPNGPLKNQDYGMREFAVLDLDGNLIKFGQPL